MTNTLQIRPAITSDLEQILQLFQYLSAGNEFSDRNIMQQRWEELLNFSGATVFVAEDGYQLLSTCTLIMVPNLTRDGRPYALIENVVTRDTARRRGLAKEVLNAATDFAWSNNCYKVMLLSGQANIEAHKLYDDLGFTRDKIGFQLRR